MLPIQVYAEATPNPAAMKFVCSVPLLHEGSVEYFSKEEAFPSPLAAQLFSFTGVKSVFITANFVTVTKENDIDWYDIMNIIREFIRGYLAAGEKPFTSNPFKNAIESNVIPPAQSSNENLGEIEEKIIMMLEEYVKPAVEQDGGAIHFRSFENGVVTLALKGSCSGCPSSTITLKAGIENLLKKMVPEVTEVVAEAE